MAPINMKKRPKSIDKLLSTIVDPTLLAGAALCVLDGVITISTYFSLILVAQSTICSLKNTAAEM